MFVYGIKLSPYILCFVDRAS